jgi:hypothetical protein
MFTVEGHLRTSSSKLVAKAPSVIKILLIAKKSKRNFRKTTIIGVSTT